MSLAARLLAGALATAVGTLVAATGLGHRADLVASDLVAAARPPGDDRSRSDAASAPVVVVALDEETHARPPFASIPRALWTPHLATVVDALLAAGATVVGLDIVFATTAESMVPDYDRPLRLALRAGAKAGRVVAAEIRNPTRPLVPNEAYFFALGADNIRSANVLRDADDVVRSMPLTYDGVNGFPAEIAARHVARQGSAAPLVIPEILPLALPAAAVAAPTLSLADIHACALAGKLAFLESWVKGRVVLVGTDLVNEDRFSAGNRFALAFARPAPEPTARCTDAASVAVPTTPPRTIAGVQLQAAAVAQLLEGRVPATLPAPARLALCAMVASIAAAALLGFTGTRVALVTALAGGLMAPLAALAGPPTLLVPAGAPPLAALVAAILALAAREGLGGRAMRRLRRSFGLYLPASEVDRLLATGQPRLGGESRDVTIMFVDIASYSRLAERSDPAGLVALLNAHFARLGEVISAHRGFVFQYLGDGLLAVFGAPGELPDHPQAAVAAAACLAATRAASPPVLSIRIGIATGTALVGNIGSPHRFNYAVVGDVVNLAARLEGLNKTYGTSVLVGESTAARCPAPSGLREIDRVQVAGREATLSVFELRDGDRMDAASDQRFADALAAYRLGEFDRTAELLSTVAAQDGPARMLRERALALARSGPQEGWTGVFAHREK